MIAAPALILAAHGSGDGSRANLRVTQWAAEIRRARPGLEVAAAFQLGTPRFREALDGIAAHQAIVVPLLTGAGFFLNQRLPAELALNRRASQVRFRITAPIGSLPHVRRTLVERARSMARCAAGIVSVLVVGHGTERDTEGAVATKALAAEIANVLPGVDTRTAFLDQPPRIDEVLRAISADTVIVVPFLLGGGRHADDLHSLRSAFPGEVVITNALGDDDGLAEAALELFDRHAHLEAA